jgi:DNA-directed RNA polymerase subunit RPC12/RpoP
MSRPTINDVIVEMRLKYQVMHDDGPTVTGAAVMGALNEYADKLQEVVDYKEPPYIEETVTTLVLRINPDYDTGAICECGHEYNRHFDWMENNDPIGCKYCGCDYFVDPRVTAANNEPT